MHVTQCGSREGWSGCRGNFSFENNYHFQASIMHVIRELID